MSSRIRKLARLSLESAQEEQKAAEERAAELQSVETPTEDIIELVQARQEAGESTGYVEEVNDIRDELTDIKEVSEVVNEKGGITLESFAFFNMAIQRICDRTGLERPASLPSLESFDGNERVHVAIEELNNMISAVDDGTRRLETNSVEAIERLVCALTESVPNAHARIKHLLELVNAVEQKTDRPDVSGMLVAFGDGLNIALSVDGTVPENLPSYLHTYLQTGATLVDEYQVKAFEGAMKAVGIPDLLTYDSSENFWANVEKAVCDIEDPRRILTDEQQRLVLPNGESLFNDKAIDVEDGNATVAKLRKFACTLGVNEQMSNPHNVAVIAEGQTGYGRVPLSLDEIRAVAQNFDKLFQKLDMNAFAERSNGIRQDMYGVIQRVKDGYASASPEIKIELTDHFGLLVKYLEMVFKLADWPMLNYLSNLVFTTNAFVLYAERSLSLPEGAVEEAAPVADAAAPAADETAEVVADAAADEVPAAGEEVSADAGAEPAADAAVAPEVNEKPSETLAEMREEANAEDPNPAPAEAVAEAEAAAAGAEGGDEAAAAAEPAAAEGDEAAAASEETSTAEPVSADGEEEQEDAAADEAAQV